MNIYGPPGIFDAWEWLKDGNTAALGYSTAVAPYSIPSFGSYSLELDNGLCAATSKDIAITAADCSGCGIDVFGIGGYCNPAIPGRYSFEVDFYNFNNLPATYILSTIDGPMFPSTGYIAGFGFVSLSLQFNLFPDLVTPTTTDVHIVFIYEDGSRCVHIITLTGLDCGQPQQRLAMLDTTGRDIQKIAAGKQFLTIASALSLYPNPSSNQAVVAYNYGDQYRGSGYLSVYDVSGRKITDLHAAEKEGEWLLQTESWPSGVYLIRMEAGGELLHSRRLVVVH